MKILTKLPFRDRSSIVHTDHRKHAQGLKLVQSLWSRVVFGPISFQGRDLSNFCLLKRCFSLVDAFKYFSWKPMKRFVPHSVASSLSIAMHHEAIPSVFSKRGSVKGGNWEWKHAMICLNIVTRLLLNANIYMTGNCAIIMLDLLWLPWICKKFYYISG